MRRCDNFSAQFNIIQCTRDGVLERTTLSRYIRRWPMRWSHLKFQKCTEHFVWKTNLQNRVKVCASPIAPYSSYIALIHPVLSSLSAYSKLSHSSTLTHEGSDPDMQMHKISHYNQVLKGKQTMMKRQNRPGLNIRSLFHLLLFRSLRTRFCAKYSTNFFRTGDL